MSKKVPPKYKVNDTVYIKDKDSGKIERSWISRVFFRNKKTRTHTYICDMYDIKKAQCMPEAEIFPNLLLALNGLAFRGDEK